MKIGRNVIFLFKDANGFGTSLFDALRPNPNSRLGSVEDDFEFSVKYCGLNDANASAKVLHFVDDDKGFYQVSLVLLPYYEPPFLACALDAVLAALTGERSPSMPKFILPCIVSTLKMNSEARSSNSLYGMPIGQNADISDYLSKRTQKPPPSLEIHHEPVACFLHLARVMNLPTFVLIGQTDEHLSSTTREMFYEMGEVLASSVDLCFLKDKVMCNPTHKSREPEEPWRALYG